MDANSLVGWHEVLVYIKWALYEYPDIATVDEAMSITFEKGLIPAKHGEKLCNKEAYRSSSFVSRSA